MNERTLRIIGELNPRLQGLSKAFLVEADTFIAQSDSKYTVEIVEGRRDIYYQAGLYSIGRVFDRDARAWKIVGDVLTRTLESKHLAGNAFDIAFLNHDTRLYEWPDPAFCDWWMKLAEIGEQFGLVAGAKWKKPDYPHFELP